MQTFHLYIILMMLFISARASASAEQRTEMKYISLCVNDTSDSFSRPCIGNSSCAETDSAVSVSDKPSFFSKIYGIARNVGRFFNQVDSNYVKPSPKGLTVMAGVRAVHEFYDIRSRNDDARLSIVSDMSYAIGGYVYWKAIGVGGFLNLNPLWEKGGKSGVSGRKLTFKLNTSKLIGEAYYFKSSENSRISNIYSDIIPDNMYEFNGLKAYMLGANVSYVFNNRKYSWTSAFSKNTAVQKRSSGSFMLGFSFVYQNTNVDQGKIPDEIKDNMGSFMLFNRIRYWDYAVRFGYGYNWVIGKRWMISLASNPALGYRHMSKDDIGTSKRSLFDSVSCDFVNDFAVKWRGDKYSLTATYDLHTSLYWNRNLILSNNVGTIRFLVGVNIFNGK